MRTDLMGRGRPGHSEVPTPPCLVMPPLWFLGQHPRGHCRNPETLRRKVQWSPVCSAPHPWQGWRRLTKRPLQALAPLCNLPADSPGLVSKLMKSVPYMCVGVCLHASLSRCVSVFPYVLCVSHC